MSVEEVRATKAAAPIAARWVVALACVAAASFASTPMCQADVQCRQGYVEYVQRATGSFYSVSVEATNRGEYDGYLIFKAGEVLPCDDDRYQDLVVAEDVVTKVERHEEFQVNTFCANFRKEVPEEVTFGAPRALDYTLRSVILEARSRDLGREDTQNLVWSVTDGREELSAGCRGVLDGLNLHVQRWSDRPRRETEAMRVFQDIADAWRFRSPDLVTRHVSSQVPVVFDSASDFPWGPMGSGISNPEQVYRRFRDVFSYIGTINFGYSQFYDITSGDRPSASGHHFFFNLAQGVYAATSWSIELREVDRSWYLDRITIRPEPLPAAIATVTINRP